MEINESSTQPQKTEQTQSKLKESYMKNYKKKAKFNKFKDRKTVEKSIWMLVLLREGFLLAE